MNLIETNDAPRIQTFRLVGQTNDLQEHEKLEQHIPSQWVIALDAAAAQYREMVQQHWDLDGDKVADVQTFSTAGKVTDIYYRAEGPWWGSLRVNPEGTIVDDYKPIKAR
ncbi:MAG: hypothetical protein R3C68_13925 [Myxococcota bacterium]